MSNTQHTPGPWRVDDIGTNCLFIKGGVHVEAGASASEREYYSNIATITQRDPHPRLDGGIHRDVTLANANLIAAAPKLLQALEYAYACLTNQLSTKTKHDYAIDLAEEAISEAKKGQHDQN